MNIWLKTSRPIPLKKRQLKGFVIRTQRTKYISKSPYPPFIPPSGIPSFIYVWKISQNMPKNADFQFLIIQPIRPILMIYKLEKVSLNNLRTNPRYWVYKVRIRWKIAIFDVKCHFSAFSHKWKNQFFVEYSKGIEISTKIFLPPKTYGSCRDPL